MRWQYLVSIAGSMWGERQVAAEPLLQEEDLASCGDW